MIHGRIGDAVYPFTFMYHKTNDEKYLNAAKLVIDWSEYNVKREEGGYFNDKCSDWQGITVFSAEAIGDALYYHGECLDDKTYSEWKKIFLRMTEFVYDLFSRPTFKSNINYFAGEAALMALAFRLTGTEKYIKKAYESFWHIKKHFTSSLLLYGEGGKEITKEKRCYYVDIAYNVEESLPLMAKFAHFAGDRECMNFVADAFRAHLEFILPDGAWDNSFGSRANKWTYWGSRTSDGAGGGLCLLAKYDDSFLEAAERNFNLIAKCSENGHLYGGLMYKECDEEPCNHHSFCHAKMLASMLDNEFSYNKKVSLPRDEEYGLKYFKDINTYLVAVASLRATVTASDAISFGSAVSGGALSLLWAEATGPVLSAVIPRYSMNEPRNMQLSRNKDSMPNCALRISKDGFESVIDKDAVMTAKETDTAVTVSAKGRLCNISGEKGEGFDISYTFSKDNTVTITACADCDAKLLVPVICGNSDKAFFEDEKLTVKKNTSEIVLECTNAITAPCGTDYRDFHVIGGFATLPLEVKLERGRRATVSIRIMPEATIN